MNVLTCRARNGFARAHAPFGSARKDVEGDEGGELGDEEELVRALELVLHRDLVGEHESRPERGAARERERRGAEVDRARPRRYDERARDEPACRELPG